MNSPFTELAYAVGLWFRKHQLDTDKVRVVLSFSDEGQMAEAERAIKADEMWRGNVSYATDFWVHRQFKVCGVDFRLESRKDK